MQLEIAQLFLLGVASSVAVIFYAMSHASLGFGAASCQAEDGGGCRCYDIKKLVKPVGFWLLLGAFLAWISPYAWDSLMNL